MDVFSWLWCHVADAAVTEAVGGGSVIILVD